MLMTNGVGGQNMTGMSDMDGMGGMDMMKMYFHFGSTSTILFSFWKTTNWQGMLASCFGVFFIAMFYEGLKVGREFLLKRYPNGCDNWYSMLRASHLLQSVLHVVQIVISYFLMLIFMTFNMWLCIAVALGAGAGYFLFAWKRTILADNNEHCH